MNTVIQKNKELNDGKIATRNELSSTEPCYRLIYNKKGIIRYWFAKGVTATAKNIFTGSKKECDEKIIALGFKLIEPIKIS